MKSSRCPIRWVSSLKQWICLRPLWGRILSLFLHIWLSCLRVIVYQMSDNCCSLPVNGSGHLPLARYVALQSSWFTDQKNNQSIIPNDVNMKVQRLYFIPWFDVFWLRDNTGLLFHSITCSLSNCSLLQSVDVGWSSWNRLSWGGNH